MATSFIPVDMLRTKFYLREKEFNRFAAISEEQLLAYSKFFYTKQDEFVETQPFKYKRLPGLERYEMTLQYLTNPRIHFDLKTFDERLVYLIMINDPNLVIFKEFLKLDLVSLADIEKVEDQKEKLRLKQERNHALVEYEARVREQIGFYDPRLLKFEECFFKRFFNEKELITDVGINNQDGLMAKAKLLRSFNSISDERFEELKDIAQAWLSLAPEKYNTKVATYSLTHQNKLLGVNNSVEQLALFILMVDSDLDMLRIYEEESMMPETKRRIIEEFGYFSTDLLKLEKNFHERFCPDKKISVWSKTKKD